MRTLFIFLLFVSQFSFAQQKAFVSAPYVILIDTSNFTYKSFDRGDNLHITSIFSKSGGGRVLQCLDGHVFLFSDTIVTGDISQIATTGIFRITPHAVPVNTTKRNILIGIILLQYDNAVCELHYSSFADSNYPIWITNRSTGMRCVTINSKGEMFFDTLPISYSAFGSGIKKIIIQ